MELSAELHRRDAALKAIWIRVSGIWKNPSEIQESESPVSDSGYYEIRKSNMAHLILQSLQSIHDEREKHQKRNIELEKICVQLRDSLRAVEARLRQAANGDIPNELTDEIVVERIHRFVDYLIAPRFSQQFIPITEIDLICGRLPRELNEHPKAYLPKISRRFLEMEHGIAKTRPFLPILDVLLQALSNEVRELDLVFLQKWINDLHGLVQTLTNGVLLVPLFVVISRFVALVQCLVAQIGSFTGNELRVT
jgi:hypothetical protein